MAYLMKFQIIFTYQKGKSNSAKITYNFVRQAIIPIFSLFCLPQKAYFVPKSLFSSYVNLISLTIKTQRSTLTKSQRKKALRLRVKLLLMKTLIELDKSHLCLPKNFNIESVMSTRNRLLAYFFALWKKLRLYSRRKFRYNFRVSAKENKLRQSNSDHRKTTLQIGVKSMATSKITEITPITVQG